MKTDDGGPVESVELTLGGLGEMFVAPEHDPMRGQFQTQSGVDRLIQTLKPRGPRLCIDVKLTPEAGPRDGHSGYADAVGGSGIDDAAGLRAPLHGYVAERTRQLEAECARVRRLGIKELVFGCAFLMLCLVAGGALVAAFGDESWLARFVSEGLVIVGWISLWHPVDMLFFERVPLMRDRRILERIQKAEIRVS